MINIPKIDDLCARLRSGDLEREAFIEACVRLTAEVVRCSRTGLWIFSGADGHRRLHCLAMFDQASNRSVKVEDRSENGAGPYFDELDRRGHVLAHDARTHPATRGFFERDLRERNVHSLMAAAFSFNGRLYGALTCTQLGQPVRWSAMQLATLTRIGSRVTLTLASCSSHQLDTLTGPL